VKQQMTNFWTKDGLALQGVFFSPDGPKTGNAVLHLHDWFARFQSDWEFLLSTAQYLVDHGHCLLSINTRGHGVAWTWPPILGLSLASLQTGWLGGGYELFDECIYDIQAGVDFLIGEACPDIVLEGIGLGASKAVYYQSHTQNPKVKSLVLLQPRDYVGFEISQPSFKQILSAAEQLIAQGKGDEVVTRILGYSVSASSYYSKFGKDARSKGLHWLNALREESPHQIDTISDPVLVLRILEEDELSKPEFLTLIERRAAGRCDVLDAQTLYSEYAPQKDPNQILGEAICDWVDDVLP